MYLLVDYLHEHVVDKDIPIRILNGPNEILPLAYARMVFVKQAFTSLSMFGIFPVMTTYGQGYFQKGTRGFNPFAKHLLLFMPNMHMMTRRYLTTKAMSEMKLQDTLNWFVSD